MQIADKKKHYNWMVLPDTYLAMALLGCNNYTGIFKKLRLRSTHPDYEFIYPIVFNFKQGIELYIKGLGIIDEHGEYDGMHDIKYLIDSNITKAKGTGSEIIWNQFKDDIWSIIKRYYYGTYIPSIMDENHPDKQNEAERYPETRKENCYKIPEIYDWVTLKVIEEIKDDIETVRPFLEQAKRDI